MKTESHWHECKQMASYRAAHQLCLQLQEVAKANGYDPRGIRVLSKREVHFSGHCADSQVVWTDGPMGWPSRIQIKEVAGVCIEDNRPYSVSFYDILMPIAASGN